VIIPLLPGHFSALGMLLADIRHEQVRTIYREIAGIAGDELTSVAEEVRGHIAELLTSEFIAESDQEIELYLDLRYRGQEFTLRTPASDTELRQDGGLEKVRQRFDELHALRFGHSADGSPVEVVNLRVVGIGRRERFSPTRAEHEGGVDVTARRVVSGDGSQSKASDWKVYQREQLPVGYQVTGPAVIEEYASTLVIDEGDVATVSDDGALDIQIAVAGSAGSTGTERAAQ
jgi:N-methylhydantoinase A